MAKLKHIGKDYYFVLILLFLATDHVNEIINTVFSFFQFDAEHYYNSCTMKSCCFAGDNDQFVLSGSDDFNLYMWKIPESNSGSECQVYFVCILNCVMSNESYDVREKFPY